MNVCFDWNTSSETEDVWMVLGVVVTDGTIGLLKVDEGVPEMLYTPDTSVTWVGVLGSSLALVVVKTCSRNVAITDTVQVLPHRVQISGSYETFKKCPRLFKDLFSTSFCQIRQTDKSTANHQFENLNSRPTNYIIGLIV